MTRGLTREHEATEARRRALARERSAAAELKRLDEVRSQMLAQVAHDLSTPISFIAGTVEMLADGSVCCSRACWATTASWRSWEKPQTATRRSRSPANSTSTSCS